MRSRSISGTKVHLTELAFGGASIGNLFEETTDSAAAQAVAMAWDCGIRYFDTAPHYGLGLSERRLGSALAQYPRSEVVISTKVGRLLVRNEIPTRIDSEMFAVPGSHRREWDFSRDGIMRSVESSLSRLNTDYVDILYLHDPDQSGMDAAAERGAATLIELREEGVVGAVGIGSNSARAVAELLRTADIDVAMIAGRYTLLEQRGADEVFEAAAGRSIVAAGVFNSGLLSTSRPQVGAKYNYETAPPHTVATAHRYADVAESLGATLPQVALAFPLTNPAIASVVVGMRTAEQVADNVDLLRSGPPDQIWKDLLAEGLLEESWFAGHDASAYEEDQPRYSGKKRWRR